MKLKLLAILLCFTSTTLAQSDSTSDYDEDDTHFIFSTGLSNQKQLWGEVGIIYGKTLRSSCDRAGLAGVKLGTEFNFTPSKFMIAPKIGFEFDIAIFGARMNIIDYTDFTYHDFKFTPEIGLSFLGLVDVFYGYNYSISEKRIDNIGTHRLTLTVNFDWWHTK